MRHGYFAGLASACLLVSLLGLPAWAEEAPPGLYKINTPPLPFGAGCQSIKMDHGTLSASCLNFFQSWVQSSLPDAAKCAAAKHEIENINGSLRCVISSVPVRALSNPWFYVGDIVSIVKDEVTAAGETRIIRIDQPRVDLQSDPFPNITFKLGDSITLNAGGCAQSGGGGSTWKSYLGIEQTDAPYYAGTVSVPGAIESGPIGGAIHKTWRVTQIPPIVNRNDTSLTLGYLDDEYDDNGYYAHDNGNVNQCANVGPAWVEITITSGAVQKGLVWSPHSQQLPFDLTWDENNEDFNGLPLNAQWSYQLEHPGNNPDFASACGPSFHSQDAYDTRQLAAQCSSQAPTADFDSSFFQGLGGYCTGLFGGHLNWYLATYTGTVKWAEFSGWWPNDGDFNLWLLRADNAGQTADQSALGLEFDGGETLANAGGAWWARLDAAGESSITLTGANAASSAPVASMLGGDVGLPAVVTGLVGIDGVHGRGSTELHPVFAIAINTQTVRTATSVRETWVFFLRNSGDEGNCSEQTHAWISPADNAYAIQLPWPAVATGVKVVGDAQWWAWQDAAAKGAILRSADPGWTIIKVQFPPGVFGGVDGEFTLEYSMPTGQQPVPPKGAAKARTGKEHESQLRDLIAQIKDPTTALHLNNELLALKPATLAPQKARRISFDTSLAVQPRTPGAASHGKGTRTRDARDEKKRKVNESIKAVLVKYAAQVPARAAVPAAGASLTNAAASAVNPAASVGSQGSPTAATQAATSPASVAAPALLGSQANSSGGLACTYQLGSSTFVRNTKRSACPATAAPPGAAAGAAAAVTTHAAPALTAAAVGAAALVSSQPNTSGGLACTYQEGSLTFTRNTRKAACPQTSTAPAAKSASSGAAGATPAAAPAAGSASLVSSQPNASGGLACTYQEGSVTFTRNTKKAACPPTAGAPAAAAAKRKTPSPGTVVSGEAVLIKSQEVSGKLECTYRRGSATFTRATQKAQCPATEK
jgi:hypothetical protein